jgi:hypothetical protein
LRTLRSNVIDARLDFADAIADPATVGFQFLFARPANPDSSGIPAPSSSATTTFSALARHGGTAASEAREHVVQLRQLHLQLTFAAPSVAREDIQNQLSPVNDPPLGGFFNVALLNRGKIAIENDQRSLVCGGFGADLIEFAAANQSSGIGDVTYLE